jgi:serine/threonine-protein kinase
MSPEVHQRVRGIFDKVLDRPERERRQFLRRICGGDDETYRAVERLLAAHDDSSSFLDHPSPDTRRFGRYVISRELGRGSMGIVYEATDPLIGRAVAVKIIRLQPLTQPDNAGFLRERLFREARSAGGLSHPGIVTIYDVGFENDVAFIAMERVNGPSLHQMLVSASPFDYGRALDILGQTAAALDYAHQHGVIHRDVKPANIMLHEGITAKITDFGIAKIVSTAEQTRTGTVLGTPSHMSPEQIEARPLDGRSDQFSLATVAFRLLTGEEPFHAESLAPLLHKILFGPRPSAQALNPALPPEVDIVLQRGLEKAPEARYGTCAELVAALEKAIECAPAWKRPSPDQDALTETLTRGTEPNALNTTARTGAFKRRAMFAGLATGAFAAVAALVYFSGALPSRRSSTVTAPSKPAETPLIVAAITPPPPTPAPVSLPAKDVDLPPPSDDKPARARQIYDEAIKSRKAKQRTRAIELFRKAANLGDARAMLELGETFMTDSDSAPADYPQALMWFRKAAAAGNSSGMVELGGMYLLGAGVDEDFETAAAWFRKAAAAGDSAAMYNLALMYESGEGVAQDREKARQLFAQAAGLGNQEARRRLALFDQ